MVAILVNRIGNHEVRSRAADKYVDATKLCKAGGKKWSHYRENASTSEFIQALSESTGIPTESLIESRSGRDGGTWIHPQVAINFAQWVNPHFAVQVSEWVIELLTVGTVSVNPASVTLTPEQFERLTGRVEHLQTQLDRMAAQLTAPQPVPPLLAPVVARWTVRNRMEFLGYTMPREARRKVHRIAVGLTESHSDEPLCQSGGMGGGGPTYWTPGNVDHLDKAIRQVWGMLEAKRLKDECRQPTIPFDARKAS